MIPVLHGMEVKERKPIHTKYSNAMTKCEGIVAETARDISPWFELVLEHPNLTLHLSPTPIVTKNNRNILTTENFQRCTGQ